MVNSPWLHASNNYRHGLCAVSDLSTQISFPLIMFGAFEVVFYSDAQRGSPAGDRESYENE